MPVKVEEQKVEEPKEVIFYSMPEMMQVANYIPEKKEGASIIRPEGSLIFNNHSYVTSDPDKIAHIRKSDSFAANTIRECKDYAELKSYVLGQLARKSVKEIRSEHTESVAIN